MPGYRLLKHRQYERNAERLPDSIRRKAMWAQVLLGTRGRTPNVKTTTGYNARWRRTPVQGYHYYLWWIPLAESELADRSGGQAGQTILVHSIRHHDETDDPIDLISLDEFDEVSLASIDPRFDEQRDVGVYLKTDRMAPATVKGLPGSGKTVALFYLVRDLILQRGLESLLYVTYTARLKRAAREFLAAQAPELEQRIHIRTLTELEKELTGLPAALDPLQELADFRRYLDMQPAAILGGWRRYPAALYTEIRAHILGRTFPVGYPLPAPRVAEAVFSDGAFNLDAYAAARRLTRDEAATAVRLSERLRGDRFFLDQVAAGRALNLLAQSGESAGGRKLPGWLRRIDALVVDEIQDLTLLQIALLAELARMRLRSGDRQLAVVFAGDESQIVQPSGFDWGVTKDLLREVLGANPQEFEFRHQRRSPRNLAYVIDSAWNFYVRLPKQLRPSANRQSFLDDADMELSVATHRPDSREENGRLLICPLPVTMQDASADAARQWRDFVEELADLPGRALIDLNGSVPTLKATEDEAVKAEEVIFDVREIKGLERNTVIVVGLDATFQQAMRLADSSDMPPLFEARRLIDEMRVALSRSTDKLVLLEAPNAPVLAALEIDNLEGHYTMTWEALRDLLRTEQMSEIEVVEGYLDEVDDLIERGRWEQARNRNRRAYEFAVQLADRTLQREAQAQYIQSFLQEAAVHLLHDRLAEALHLNQQARTLAAELGDPAVIDEADEQREALSSAVEMRLHAAQAPATPHGDLAGRYAHLQALAPLVMAVEDARLRRTLDEAMITTGWQWGVMLLKAGPEARKQLATLFTELAAIMRSEADDTGAALAALVAQRYTNLPHASALTGAQVRALLGYIDDSLQALAPLSLDGAAYAFVAHWLEESFAHLGEDHALYYDWAVRAERYNQQAGYPDLDDRLWDLENRVELMYGAHWTTASQDKQLLRFGAFIAAYNGNPHDASLAWEKLGELELAIRQAREAGELERAYHLMRQAGQPIPDALSTAVKLVRQAAQLANKLQNLSKAERRALAEALHALLATLDVPLVSPDDDDALDAEGDDNASAPMLR
ncbi:MAG TPA: hypothetical protein DCL15_01435 [Chloroflexi bacterium]|nr:hypothetical protein [Chloroflexota bacterium]HHW85902.1 AAA family ATPase [Chloroflexota bacterium]